MTKIDKEFLDGLITLSDEEKKRCLWHNHKPTTKTGVKVNLDYCGNCDGFDGSCSHYISFSDVIDSYSLL